MKRFFDGTFKGVYKAELIQEFEMRLPATPPWKKEMKDER